MHFCTKHKASIFFSKCATWIKLQKKNAAIRSAVQYSTTGAPCSECAELFVCVHVRHSGGEKEKEGVRFVPRKVSFFKQSYSYNKSILENKTKTPNAPCAHSLTYTT